MQMKKKTLIISILLVLIIGLVACITLPSLIPVKSTTNDNEPNVYQDSNQEETSSEPKDVSDKKEDKETENLQPKVAPTDKPVETVKPVVPTDKPKATSEPVTTPKPVTPPVATPKPVAPPVATPAPTAPPVVEHYHGNGSDGGTCPACGVVFSPDGDLSGDDGAHDAGDLT